MIFFYIIILELQYFPQPMLQTKSNYFMILVLLYFPLTLKNQIIYHTQKIVGI